MDPYPDHSPSRRLRQEDQLENPSSSLLDEVRMYNGSGIKIGIEVRGGWVGGKASKKIGRRCEQGRR